MKETTPGPIGSRPAGRAVRPKRAPILVPSPQGWAGREAVRALRVRVDASGSLLVDRPGVRPQCLAAPGEVTRIVLVDRPTGLPRQRYAVSMVPSDGYGLLVFFADDRPVLALWLAEWLPTAVRDLDDRDARETSGANAVAVALGRPIEAGDVPVDARVRKVLLTVRPSLPVRSRVTLALGYAAVLVWLVLTLSPLFTGRQEPAAVGYLGAAGALAITGTCLVLGRRAARSLPAPPGRTIEPVPAGPVPRAFRERARMHVSAEWIVLVDAVGREGWLPGPALGGVTSASVTTDAVVLDASAGIGVAGLPRDVWTGDAASDVALRTALADAGVPVRDEPSNRTAGEWLTSPVVLNALDDPFFAGMREARGVPARSGAAGGIVGLLVAYAAGTGEPGVLAAGLLAFGASAVPQLLDHLAEKRAKEQT